MTSSLTRRLTAVVAALLLVVAAVVAVLLRRGSLTLPVAGSGGRSRCATDVRGYLAGGTAADDTAGFLRAMQHALATDHSCYRAGPLGPQAVVYVPPGTYRLRQLAFPSNVRLEVSAGATLEPTADRPATPDHTQVALIEWGSATGSAPQVRNVSIVGVGSAGSAAKTAAQQRYGRYLAGFDLGADFTLDLDPATTGATNYDPGIDAVNVDGFSVADVFAQQNATDQRDTGKLVAWPTSARAVVQLRAAKSSPLQGPFRQPSDGTISALVDVGAPRGYGPDQIDAGTGLRFDHVFSAGGTALRIETDGSLGKGHRGADRGATVSGLVARDIVGVDCNRAVSLSPHGQRNGTVRVDGVWSYGCYEAVVASYDGRVPKAQRGDFSDAVVTGVHAVAGTSAQAPVPGRLWGPARSVDPVYVARGVTWHPRVTVVQRSGSFAPAP